MARARIFTFSRLNDGLAMAHHWLAELTAAGEVVVLGASNAAAREFIRLGGGTPMMGAHPMTLAQLASALARPALADRRLAPLSRLGSEAVAARVAQQRGSAEQLAYFGPVADRSGFAAALASTLSEMQLAGLGPDQLTGHGPQAEDLRLLLIEYRAELARRGLADLPQLLEFAIETTNLGHHPLLGLPLLLLDVPLHSSRHAALLKALADRAGSALAIAQSHDEAGLHRLEQALGVKADPPRNVPPRNALARAAAHLFSGERPPEGDPDGSVDVFSAPGEGGEAVEIARRIRKFADDSIAFDRIAVLLRAPERYQPLLEEALGRAGIPAYFSRGTVRPDPAGRAFLALLACAAERCSASRFSEYLSLGQVPRLDSAGAPPPVEPHFVPPEDELLEIRAPLTTAGPEPDEEHVTVATPIAWERLLVDAAVIGGPDRWNRRLKGLEAEYRLHLAGEADPSERHRIEQQIERLGNLERFALPLIDLLSALPVNALWSEWLVQLRRLAATALRFPESVLAVLNELEPMGGVGPVGIEEVRTVLGDRLRFLRREPPRRRYGQVFIGAIDECRGRSFDVVFLPGLAEGIFPRRSFEDPLLLDDLRARLSPELSRATDRVAAERLLLRTAVSAALHALVTSFPTMDLSQGRPRVPSFYALEIVRAVEGRVPNLRTFEVQARAKAEARLTWPAPLDPALAIDDAEYDLAWYAAHSNERGSCKYLDNVQRPTFVSLRMQYLRGTREWTAADGMLKPDAGALAILQSRDPTAHPYSASSLQHFSACPYRFYLHAVYRLRPREKAAPLQELDPLTRGALFHAVQFRFFQEWRKQPGSEVDRLMDILDAAVDSVADEYEEKLAPAIARVWRGEVEDMRTDLRAWMRIWCAGLSEWEPLYFELAFGLGAVSPTDHDPASSPQTADLEGLARLRGSMDLVERQRAGGSLRIVDHKTGKPPQREPASVAGGAVLQPALYAMAAETLLGLPVAGGRLHYCTQRGGFRSVDIDLDSKTRERAQIALTIVREQLNAGSLPAAPQSGACDYCDYRAVCGSDDVRTKRWKAPLDRLIDLRNLP